MLKPHSQFLAFACLPCTLAVATEVNPPNIVVIVVDDLGYADVVFNPQHPQEIGTPHLGALAKESVICRQGYVSGHVCSITRAGLMTGRYQQRLGLYTGGEAGSGLPMSEQIFPQFIAPAGYATCQLGKWHLGPTPEWSPALRGFDEVFGFLGRGAHDYFKLNDPDDPIYRGTKPVEEKRYLTDRLGEEAVSFIERHKSKPFLLYLAFNAVHAPLQAPADEIAKFNTGNTDRNTLLAMGKRMDDAIGNIVASLKKDGVWDNTLLFFISDNGGPLAQTANNTPLRGGKHQDYEGGVRVPFLVCWPNQLKPGESQAVVSSLDILPTALAAAGIASPKSKPLDGEDILPILRQSKAAPPRNLFWSTGAEEGWWAVRSGDWKLVGDKEKVGLFDLSKDIAESNDLASKMPEKLKELTTLHDAWLAEMAEPMRGEGKRYGLGTPEVGKKRAKKPKAKLPLSEEPTSVTRGTVSESFATLPNKPWKAQRGSWEVKDDALWGAQKHDDKQAAKLTGPASFRSGVLRCEINLSAGSELSLRFKSGSGETMIRSDITPDGITVAKLAADGNPHLQKIKQTIATDKWQTLTLKFDGPEFVGELGEMMVIATDEVFDREKSAIEFMVSGGPVGVRNFLLTPAVDKRSPQE